MANDGGGGGLGRGTVRDIAESVAEGVIERTLGVELEEYGVSFLEDPVDFIITVILDWLIGGIVSTIQAIVQMILDAGGVVTSTLRDVGLIFGGVFGDLGQVLLIPVELITTIATTVIASTGPAAPFVALIVWAIVAIMAAMAARAVISLLPLVIPWL